VTDIEVERIISDARLEWWVEAKPMIEKELLSERTSSLVLWVAHPLQLRDDLMNGWFDSIKPSQAMLCFEQVADCIGWEIDQRIPARGHGT
jgi:hypothetical protein